MFVFEIFVVHLRYQFPGILIRFVVDPNLDVFFSIVRICRLGKNPSNPWLDYIIL